MEYKLLYGGKIWQGGFGKFGELYMINLPNQTIQIGPYN